MYGLTGLDRHLDDGASHRGTHTAQDGHIRLQRKTETQIHKGLCRATLPTAR
jgi:hypothetical protein